MTVCLKYDLYSQRVRKQSTVTTLVAALFALSYVSCMIWHGGMLCFSSSPFSKIPSAHRRQRLSERLQLGETLSHHNETLHWLCGFGHVIRVSADKVAKSEKWMKFQLQVNCAVPARNQFESKFFLGETVCACSGNTQSMHSIGWCSDSLSSSIHLLLVSTVTFTGETEEMRRGREGH